MVYICTIIPLAVLYIAFAPDQFFGCYYSHRHTIKLIINCILVPTVINSTSVIHRVENDINKIVILIHLCQPAAIGEFYTVAFIRKKLKYACILAWLAKNVQVFGIAENTGMVPYRKSTAQQKWFATFIQ